MIKNHKLNFFHRKNGAGFTLIELLVVIAVIGLLASVVMVALNSARAKARYTRALADMKQITTAAENDYDDRGSYAPDAGTDTDPGFVPKYLSNWPKPPCSGWTYDWENWVGIGGLGPGQTGVRITLRRPDVSTVYYYCVYTTSDCAAGNGSPIQTLASKSLTCTE